MVATLIFYALIQFVISFFACFHLLGVHEIGKRFNEDFHDYERTDKMLRPIRTHMEIFQVFPLLVFVAFGIHIFNYLEEKEIPRVYGGLVCGAIFIVALILAITISGWIFGKDKPKRKDDEE